MRHTKITCTANDPIPPKLGLVAYGLHECPIIPPQRGTETYAVAAISTLRAHAAETTNLQDGLEADIWISQAKIVLGAFPTLSLRPNGSP